MYYKTQKEPIYNPTLKWYINHLSYLERTLSKRELRVDKILKKDLNQVKEELNLTISELLCSGEN
jgi:hypothetical protein